MAEMSDREILDALGVDSEQKKARTRSPREERIVAGFEDIQRFVEENDRLPEHGEDKDIFERLYAVRLDQIRRKEECRSAVLEVDHQGLLDAHPEEAATDADELDDSALLAELGVETQSQGDITELKHVKPRTDVRAAEEIASRTRCEDFEEFRPLFENVQKELDQNVRITIPFKDNAEVNQGDLFILTGQKVYVAEIGEEFITEYDRRDSRLRVIYDNGTESDILMRSLQRALNKDPVGRRISEPSAGPLFSGEYDQDDLATGTIYVLRSKSDHALVAKNRKIVHKIGVTGGDVKKRITNARHDPTFLLSEVEVVATYELYNINRTKLENLLHRVLESARLDIQIKDRFGHTVIPREWFLVPLFVIDDIVEKLKDGTLKDYYYNAESARLERHRTARERQSKS
tara:strand:- start:1631 stop:2842 length:1212 start_codon:yes stop_codon:yes gene_type:complete